MIVAGLHVCGFACFGVGAWMRLMQPCGTCGAALTAKLAGPRRIACSTPLLMLSFLVDSWTGTIALLFQPFLAIAGVAPSPCTATTDTKLEPVLCACRAVAAAESAAGSSKPPLHLVVLGHVDAGKSAAASSVLCAACAAATLCLASMPHRFQPAFSRWGCGIPLR